MVLDPLDNVTGVVPVTLFEKLKEHLLFQHLMGQVVHSLYKIGITHFHSCCIGKLGGFNVPMVDLWIGKIDVFVILIES